jgi:prepilin-type N-terminal cleavage/methylation domain-containing protein
MDRGVTAGQGGFTLVELLIVVAVLALLSVGAGFSTGRVAAGRAGDAARFAALHERLREAAVFERRPAALSLEAGGWRRLTPDADSPTGWRAAGETGRFRGETRFAGEGGTLGRPGADALEQPDLVFLPGGASTPFRVSFISGDGVIRCDSDGWTGLSCRGL